MNDNQELTPKQHNILRCGGTEEPFTGKYYKETAAGMYECVGCGNELFNSQTKYDSGSGWPSFWAPAQENGSVQLRDDSSAGMTRTEVVCAQCKGHLGHVFDDGPSEHTGKRFCINSAALNLKKEKSG